MGDAAFTTFKPRVLVVISALVLAICIPVILPHISHPHMIYHILLHIGSLVVAIFITTVALLAYNRARTARMLLMAGSLLFLTTVVSMDLISAIQDTQLLEFPGSNIELTHILLLIMLILFGSGMLKVNNTDPHIERDV